MVSRISQPRPQLAGDHPTILIVEDEQASRRALTLLLAVCGYRTCSFGSAEEALAGLAGGTMPRIALIDLDLPGMSGLDLIDRLERLDPKLRCVLVTATDEDSLRRRIGARNVSYLRKPVDFDALLGILSQRLPPMQAASTAAAYAS